MIFHHFWLDLVDENSCGSGCFLFFPNLGGLKMAEPFKQEEAYHCQLAEI